MGLAAVMFGLAQASNGSCRRSVPPELALLVGVAGGALNAVLVARLAIPR